MFLCETPGIWGSLPKGYDHLWSGIIEAYVTYNVAAADRANFTFKKGECSLGVTAALLGGVVLYPGCQSSYILVYSVHFC